MKVTRTRQRLTSALTNVLLFGIAAIVVGRFGALSSRANILTALSEKRFVGWPYGTERFAFNKELTRAAPFLRDNETVCLVRQIVDRGGPTVLDPPWPIVMADYFWSRQIVVMQRPDHLASGPACRRLIAVYERGHPLVIRRSPLAGLDR